MNAGRFRPDLYFRIAQVRVELPSLRERIQDLPLLVEDVCKRVGRTEQAPAVIAWIEQRMASHDWPGNVRELVNVASVAATLADQPGAIDDVLTLAREPQEGVPSQPSTAFTEAKRAAVAGFEREYFTTLARKAKGNVSEMARRSGMERHHVRAYLRKYGVDKGAFGD
jgi:DNA-binding NtrC family response regulator